HRWKKSAATSKPPASIRLSATGASTSSRRPEGRHSFVFAPTVQVGLRDVCPPPKAGEDNAAFSEAERQPSGDPDGSGASLMPRVRLGAVGYLNARPLVYGLDASAEFDLRFDVPSKCAELLHEGAIDVGLIPSIEYNHPITRTE